MPIIPSYSQIIPSVFHGDTPAQKSYQGEDQTWPNRKWQPPVAGYDVWLDPTDTSTFTFGTNNQIATWTDKSAHEFVFSRTASTAIQRNGWQNGLPTVDIASAGSLKCATGPGIGVPTISMFIVYKKKPPNQTYDAVPFTLTANNLGRPLDGYDASRWVGNAAWTYAANDISYQMTWNVMTQVAVSATSAEEWKNGVSVVTGTPGTFLTNSQVLCVGSRGDNATQFIGEVGDIIVYSTALDPTDRAAVEDSLLARWGIS